MSSLRIATIFVALLLVAALAPAASASFDLRAGSLAATDAFAPQLVTVHTATRADKDRLIALGLDATEHAGHDYIEVVLHSAAQEQLLRDQGFTWDVRIADLLARQLERIQLDAAFAEANAVTDLPSGRNAYRSLGDYSTEIDALVAAAPEIAKRISIGQSVEGRDLLGIEIGEDVNEPEDGRPVYLMFGAHHAREWPSAELPMEFAHDLVNTYLDGDAADHDRVRDLLARGRVIIVPVSNPDGYNASRINGDLVDLRAADGGGTASILATPGNAYKRKNCRYVNGNDVQDGQSCLLLPSNGGLGIGTDLNRNYGANWGGPGASSENTSATYRGPAPFSEPETQAIRNLISTRQVTTLITNHTFSNLLLRPVGVAPATIVPDGSPAGFAPDECFAHPSGHDYGMQALGERMTAQTGYSNQFGWELYDTTGTTEDYSYNATGGYGYTFEIGPDEFHPPFENVIDEYTGETASAENVTAENAADLTTAAGDDCGGDVDHSHGVGGGMREAYLIAFENAVDAGTHSLITGTAPAGSEIEVSRTGTFPLWDGTDFADTVTTTMVTDADGQFAYHVNPSTRPFNDSRNAPQLSEPVASIETSGTARPLSSVTHDLQVDAEVDLIRATVSTSIPIDGQAVTYNEMHVALLDPFGTVVAEATEFGPTNSLVWYGYADGSDFETGTYQLRVSNSIAATSSYDLEAYAQNVLAPQTSRTEELWTVSCNGNSTEVLVDRGRSVDVGSLCG